MNDIEKRLHILERRINRYRTTSILLGICLASMVFIGATGNGSIPKILKTQQLQIVDQKGRAVIVASTDQIGRGTLVIMSDEENQLIRIGAGISGNGQIKIQSKNDKGLVHIGAGKNGNGLLSVISKRGNNLFYAGASKTGNGLLRIKSRNSKKVLEASVNEQGGYMDMYNSAGMEIVQIFVEKGGNGALGVYDAEGEGRILRPKSSTR